MIANWAFDKIGFGLRTNTLLFSAVENEITLTFDCLAFEGFGVKIESFRASLALFRLVIKIAREFTFDATIFS